MISQFFKKFIKTFIFAVLILTLFCSLFIPSAEAKLEVFQNNAGVELTRSLENLRDLDYQTWQLIVYPQKDNDEHLTLRIVGFVGSLRLDHRKKLNVKSGIKYWNLENTTSSSPELVNDNRDAVAEFELDPLLKDLKANRPLRLFLEGGFNELPVPPYLVNEWRSIYSSNFKYEK